MNLANMNRRSLVHVDIPEVIWFASRFLFPPAPPPPITVLVGFCLLPKLVTNIVMGGVGGVRLNTYFQFHDYFSRLRTPIL